MAYPQAKAHKNSTMISIRTLTHDIGSRTLYDNIDLQIGVQDKIGLIGPNGSGKSTLLKIIAKECTPTQGQIQYDKTTTIGFFNQELLS